MTVQELKNKELLKLENEALELQNKIILFKEKVGRTLDNISTEYQRTEKDLNKINVFCYDLSQEAQNKLGDWVPEFWWK